MRSHFFHYTIEREKKATDLKKSEFFMDNFLLFVLFQQTAVEDDAYDEADHEQVEPQQEEDEEHGRAVQFFHRPEAGIDAETEGGEPAEQQGEQAAARTSNIRRRQNDEQCGCFGRRDV